MHEDYEQTDWIVGRVTTGCNILPPKFTQTVSDLINHTAQSLSTTPNQPIPIQWIGQRKKDNPLTFTPLRSKLPSFDSFLEDNEETPDLISRHTTRVNRCAITAAIIFLFAIAIPLYFVIGIHQWEGFSLSKLLIFSLYIITMWLGTVSTYTAVSIRIPLPFDLNDFRNRLVLINQRRKSIRQSIQNTLHQSPTQTLTMPLNTFILEIVAEEYNTPIQNIHPDTPLEYTNEDIEDD